MKKIEKELPITEYEKILKYLGEDPTRNGLAETPKRHLKFLKEFLNPKEFNMTTFPNEGTDSMVIQTNISFNSLCEHHILPFRGYAHVAYIPNDKIVGLSKLARTVEFFSHRLQTQERITSQVAEFLMEKLDAKGVAVLLDAEHSCMSFRGIKKAGAMTSTSKMLGAFKEDQLLQKEFNERVNAVKIK